MGRMLHSTEASGDLGTDQSGPGFKSFVNSFSQRQVNGAQGWGRAWLQMAMCGLGGKVG